MASLPRSITELINAFERLPGIGPKSATRLTFYLLSTPVSYVESLANLLSRMKKKIKTCPRCYSVTEGEMCDICQDSKRNRKQICVVERAIDVMVIENMGGYKGIYHVLGGVINPLEHIGPEDLKLAELLDRIEGEEEIILAMNPTMEGEATALYIKRKIEELKVEGLKITRIGSGLPMGADLEFADEATIARAMDGRRGI